MPNKFTENTGLEEILKSPRASKILAKYNLPCLHCPMTTDELGMLKIKRSYMNWPISFESVKS
jgi:hypothetical protein